MRDIAFGIACGIASWALLAWVVHAGEVTIGNLVVTQAWSRATPGGAPVAGGYLSIENKGSLPDRLLSGSADAARKVEIHEMALDNGIMTMRPVEGRAVRGKITHSRSPVDRKKTWALACSR